MKAIVLHLPRPVRLVNGTGPVVTGVMSDAPAPLIEKWLPTSDRGDQLTAAAGRETGHRKRHRQRQLLRQLGRTQTTTGGNR